MTQTDTKCQLACIQGNKSLKEIKLLHTQRDSKSAFCLVGGKDNFTTFAGVNFENYPCLKKGSIFIPVWIVKRKLLSARV